MTAARPATPYTFWTSTPQARAEMVRRQQARFHLRDSMRLLVMLGRPRTCIPGLFAYVLGLSYAGPVGFNWLHLPGAAEAFLFGFVANLANTYTDVDEDCRNLPGRMLLLYRFGRRRLLYTVLGFYAFMGGLSLLYGTSVFIFMLIGLIVVHEYSFRPLRMKARAFTGLFLFFAQAVSFPFMLGWFAARGGVHWPDPAVWVMFVFLLLLFVAKGFFKNVPDYEGDREAGVRTSATVFPSRRAAAGVTCGVTMAIYLAFPLLVPLRALPVRDLLAAPWIVVAAVQCWRLYRAADMAVANKVLRADMALSSAFIGTILLLRVPSLAAGAAVIAGAAIMAGSDLLAMDSRRDSDTDGNGAVAWADSGADTRASTGAAAAAPRQRPATPQELFNRVAGRYDLFNSLLSVGQDRRWRRRTAQRLNANGALSVLDVATGTASVALAVARRLPEAQITGCDLNAAMLEVARRKVAEAGMAQQIRLLRASGERLPFGDETFDAVCIAFAIDDMADRRRCATEIARVLRPGGEVLLLELGIPENPWMRSCYLGGLKVMEIVGRARGLEGYQHLREEIIAYRGTAAIRLLFQDVGLSGYSCEPLTGGVAFLHRAVRGEDKRISE